MRRSRPRYPYWRSNRPHYSQPYRSAPPPYIPYHQANSVDVFDFLNLPDSFPTIKKLIEDPTLTSIIMERSQQLTPTPADSFALMNFVNDVRQKLDVLVLAPASFTACQVAEVRDVGSHKHGTLIRSTNKPLSADLVVVLKTLPTREAIEQLANRLKQDLQSNNSSNTNDAPLEIKITNYGFSLESGSLAVHLLVTTQINNWNSLDPSIHLNRDICRQNLNAIKHSKWIDEVCIHPSNKLLVRLLKDLRQRFLGLEPLNPWLINLLAHHCVMNNQTNETLPPSYALKRALQLLSSGLFLPGSSGLHDPVNEGNNSGRYQNTTMTFEEQDLLCSTSQTLLRALSIHPKLVLGIETGPDIFQGPCLLNGIEFSPSKLILNRDESNGHSLTEQSVESMNS